MMRPAAVPPPWAARAGPGRVAGCGHGRRAVREASRAGRSTRRAVRAMPRRPPRLAPLTAPRRAAPRPVPPHPHLPTPAAAAAARRTTASAHGGRHPPAARAEHRAWHSAAPQVHPSGSKLPSAARRPLSAWWEVGWLSPARMPTGLRTAQRTVNGGREEIKGRERGSVGGSEGAREGAREGGS